MYSEKLVTPLSPGLKEALAEYAATHKLSMPEVVRGLLAEHLQYDLSKDTQNRIETRGRPKLYKTQEEIREVRNRKARQRRARQAAILQQWRELQKQQLIEDINNQ